MNASRTARERARAELTREIKREARRQLAAAGASGLSLRAVARELGMVSSALYRYFPSRDELLTALIIDAYDAIGGRLERADRGAATTDYRGRWRACSRAARAWARRHPHEYALVYGSPVPGYRAPAATVAPAGRVPAVLAGILADAWQAGAMSQFGPTLLPPLDEQTARVAELVAPGLPGTVIARAAMAWAQLFGLISFELFGHFANTLDPADAFFDYSVERMADFVGLAGPGVRTSPPTGPTPGPDQLSTG
jgi:AcrR family transcriptional regulator